MSGPLPDDTESTGRLPEDQDDFEVDEAAKESFPASDPPGWTLGQDHHEQSEKPEEKL